MWRTKKKPLSTIHGLERSELASARDSAGFEFVAILRPTTATVLLSMDIRSDLTSEMIAQWETHISTDESVLACEIVSSGTPHVAITLAREAKAEKKDNSEILTRLATVLPDFYSHATTMLTPMTENDVIQLLMLECDLRIAADTWPQVNAAVEESASTVSINGQSFITFDVMDDHDIDEILRQWCWTAGAGVARFNRIFRPSSSGGGSGRHSGLLTIFSPSGGQSTVQLVANEVLGLLTPAQRLRVRRLYARQQAGVVGSAGVGSLTWTYLSTRAA